MAISVWPLLLILVLSMSADAATTYSREGRFWAVRLTYPELIVLVEKVRTVVERANSTQSGRGARFSVTIGDGSDTSTFEGDFDLKKITMRPPVAYGFTLSYHAPGAAISNVRVTLEEFRRSLFIEGDDNLQIETLFVLAAQEIRQHETWFGGWPLRLATMVLLNLLATLSFPSVIFSGAATVSRGLLMRVALSMTLFVLSLGAMVDAFGPWFPGAVIYAGDPSWWNRNASTMGIVAFALTLFGIGQAYYYANRSRPPARSSRRS